jgi:hypothetical protein
VTKTELIRVGIFVGAIGAVYAAAVWLAVRSIIRRFRREPPAERAETWLRIFLYLLAVLGLLCFGYGYFSEPYSLEITRVRIETPKLAAGTRPIRLVLFSDLHSDPKPRLEETLPEAIAGEEPDLIVFTGDAINSPEALPVFKQCLESISEIAPTFVVEGNWDVWYWKKSGLYRDTAARLLDGRGEKLKVGETELWIAGVAVDHEDRLDKALAGAPPGAFTVFLHHLPDLVFDAARRKVDLYCAGHTHGGQVALPFYGALMTLSRFGKRFEAGLYREGDTWLYVNRGIGMEGGFAPRVRFCARPELTVIEIAPAPAPSETGEE